jgi:predicted DNA-binding protein
MADREKAYYVRERFEGHKMQLVFASTAKEAAEKCRRGDAELCVGEDGPHPAGISSVRREPSEDRDA